MTWSWSLKQIQSREQMFFYIIFPSVFFITCSFSILLWSHWVEYCCFWHCLTLWPLTLFFLAQMCKWKCEEWAKPQTMAWRACVFFQHRPKSFYCSLIYSYSPLTYFDALILCLFVYCHTFPSHLQCSWNAERDLFIKLLLLALLLVMAE